MFTAFGENAQGVVGALSTLERYKNKACPKSVVPSPGCAQCCSPGEVLAPIYVKKRKKTDFYNCVSKPWRQAKNIRAERYSISVNFLPHLSQLFFHLLTQTYTITDWQCDTRCLTLCCCNERLPQSERCLPLRGKSNL